MTIRSFGAALTLLVATGCAATQKSMVGVSRDIPAEHSDTATHHTPRADSGADPLFGIDEPFHGKRLADGNLFSDVGLLDELANYDLICVGEHHDDANDHWAQLAVLYGLSTRAEMTGRDLALGLEMVESRFQPQLDRYCAGEVALAELPDKVEWPGRWGFDFALYRPLFELASSRNLPILGLNARREVIRTIAKKGLDGLDPQSRAELPSRLDFRDPQHRATFDAAMEEHRHGGEPEHLYAAQVVWDETMASGAAAWLLRRQPARQILVAAGRAHCQDSAIPARVQRRVRGSRVVSVFPSKGPAAPEDAAGYDIVMVIGSNQ